MGSIKDIISKRLRKALLEYETPQKFLSNKSRKSKEFDVVYDEPTSPKSPAAGVMLKQQLKGESNAAAGIVIYRGDEVYLIFENGIWAIPKGSVDEGEDMKEAAKRELYEETGIRVTNEEMIDLGINRIDRPIKIFAVYMESVPEFKRSSFAVDEGITDARWINIDEAIPAVKQNQRIFLERLKSINKKGNISEMKSEKELTKVGKYIALLLRHKPEKENLDMDSSGWVSVKQLLNVLGLTKSELDFIVNNNNKRRYEYDKTEQRIRARQGHSVNVDVGLTETKPPKQLFHGTATKNIESIYASGLTPKGRLHVHLSKDLDTAKVVGSRHGKPVIIVIDSEQMYKDGYKFYLSNNDVWLTDQVPVKYFVDKIY